tara:strand:+ start:4611 stop:4805 length:195 start_codon:yes stop_codon:yes gene_type:complete
MLKLQIAINALLELRTDVQSGSNEMCTIDAALGNIGVDKKFVNDTPGYLYQFPTETIAKNLVEK